MLLYFSGHGDRFEFDENHTGFCEFIYLADGKVLTDEWFSNTRKLVTQMEATFIVTADCCHNGGLMLGAYEQLGSSMITRVKKRKRGDGEDLDGMGISVIKI
ncbi:metacaspase 5 [Trifolium medium]|uniref:Metacaspase 5 n=1 Tax=Trifolium medium TaxID=97028 RepID=A0A392QVK5_9FABA|nr:metacaspase 5 [Trifolium medium]